MDAATFIFREHNSCPIKTKTKAFSPSAKGLALLPCKHKPSFEVKFSKFVKTKQNTKRLTISGNSKWSTPATELVCAGRRRRGRNVGGHSYDFAMKTGEKCHQPIFKRVLRRRCRRLFQMVKFIDKITRTKWFSTGNRRIKDYFFNSSIKSGLPSTSIFLYSHVVEDLLL